ncbi:MAG: M48 family metallopeptidase [Methylococcaceae bacterium]|nr:M48 family metallopeptidase [Methylococcaceae bacterium]
MADAVTGMDGGTAIDYRLRRSGRAKRVRLVVRANGIELIVPSAVSESAALAFLHHHRDWAETKVCEFRRNLAALPPARSFCDYTTLPWQGRELPLRITEHFGPRAKVAVGDTVHITLPEGLNTRDEAARRAFHLWVRPRLAATVAQLTADLAPALGARPRQIRIKTMKTRWGSCGPLNDININWLLALAPQEVLRYVVIHELCHIHQRNHSAAFWALVARGCPDFRNHRQWLRTHGPELIRRFTPTT